MFRCHAWMTLIALLALRSPSPADILPTTTAPYISEFMAANTGTFLDRDGDAEDWIELHNPTAASTDLTGWHLTDNPGNLTKFPLPNLIIPPNSYALVIASGKEGNHPFQTEIHTNFKLRRTGEFLALVQPDGETLVHCWTRYPKQQPGVSYGVQWENGQPSHGDLRRETPSLPNSLLWFGRVADTTFSIDRGLYREPFMLAIDTATEGATIYYTTDGRVPGPGNVFTGPIGETLVPGASFPITRTTTVRAMAYKEGHLASNIDTQTYLFPDDVVEQPDEPHGFPTTWTGADYGMDNDPAHLPLIAGDATLSPEAAKAVIAESLYALPSLSLALPTDDFFGQTDGIYHHTQQRGQESERAASVELIHPDGREGFQINAGLRIQGFTSRDPIRNPKHSLRLLFKERYGASRLEYPVFGKAATTSFDTLVLRSNAQDAWVYDRISNRAGQFIRDEWTRRTQLAMGWPACHGTWVHLYINGLYWGVYNPTERPDDAFMASYHGGDPSDWDVIKNHEEIIRGNDDAYFTLLGLIQNDARRFSAGYRDFTDHAAYVNVQEYLDVPSMIDYMIHNMYAAAEDWPGNFYMGHDRTGQSGGFKFLSWDNEHAMKGSVTENRTLPHRRDEDSPTKFHHPLRDQLEYRLRFADHLHRAFFNEGVLAVDKHFPQWDPQHPERNQPAARWMAISQEIEHALIAESARWGDYRRARPYTVAEDFRMLRQRLLEDWFPQRSAIVLEQFRQQGLYPDLEAPIFSQRGGFVHAGTSVAMRSQDAKGIFTPNGGTILYTLDGTDPRGTGGIRHPDALVYENPLTLAKSVTLRARLVHDGAWSALNEVRYDVLESTTFQTWMLSNHLTDPHADPDGDGLNHLAEFALATDLAEGPWALLSSTPLGLELAHGVRVDAGVTWVLEQSRDLQQWEALTYEILRESPDGPRQWRTLRLPRGDAFYRLRVELPIP